jgi:hypothetical protein
MSTWRLLELVEDREDREDVLGRESDEAIQSPDGEGKSNSK